MKLGHVLYLSYDGLFDPVGSSQIVPYVKQLAMMGYHFHIISFEKPGNLKACRDGALSLFEGLPVSWIALPYHRRPAVISTLRDLLAMKRAALDVCRKNPVSFIHARSYIAALVAKSVGKRTSLPFLFDMRGFWADERIEGGIWSLKNPVYRFIYQYFKRQEQHLLSSSAAIVSLTHAGADVLVQSWSVDESKISVIPCAADYGHFSPPVPESALALRNKYALPPLKGTRLVYVGSTGTWYLLAEMVKFYQQFRVKFSDTSFLLIINERHPVVDELKSLFPEEVHVIIKAQRSEMPALISWADYSIMFIKPSFSKKASSPIKLAESLALGLPVICNAGVGDLASVQNDGFGVVVEELNDLAYAGTADHLKSLKFDQLDLRARSSIMYGLESNVQRYFDVYQRLSRKIR